MSASKKELTRAMLEECDVVEVGYNYFVRKRGNYLQVTYPSVRRHYNSRGQIRYLDLAVSLYRHLDRGYLNTSMHKMKYAWEHGEVPVGYEVDHMNTNTFDNSVENLRLLTPGENHNRKNRIRWEMITSEELKDKSIEEIKIMIDEKIKLSANENEFYEKLKLKLKIDNIEFLLDSIYESKHTSDYIITQTAKLRKRKEKYLKMLEEIEKKYLQNRDLE